MAAGAVGVRRLEDARFVRVVDADGSVRYLATCTAFDDGYVWEHAVTIYRPTRPWELIQTGNCGSPVETGAGWLVLTHGGTFGHHGGADVPWPRTRGSVTLRLRSGRGQPTWRSSPP